MHLGLRLLFAFLLITGVAAVLLLRVFLAEVKPSVREVMEDILVDCAHLLAEVAAADLATLPAGATLEGSRLAQSVNAYQTRLVDAQIWGLHKRSLDLRVYVTDVQGRVVFDSGQPSAVGQDYSRWRDVARTLRGEYGARASRAVPGDDASSVMHVAAPVRYQGQLLGVLTVAKPQATVAQFVERAERKIFWAGVGLLSLTLVVGVAVTLWTVRSVRRLRAYALQVGAPTLDDALALRPPQLPGELGELAAAMDRMRQRLAGRQQLEHDVRAFTHELKSPLTAIQGAAELLQEELSAAERAQFSGQIEAQVARLRDLVERLLALSKLESQHGPARTEAVDMLRLSDTVLAEHAAHLAQRGLQVRWLVREALSVRGDAPMLALALSNVLMNACQHAPAGSVLELALQRREREALWSLRDHGPGVADYALPQLGRRFFATVNPVDGRRGSGLGLAIVAQVMALHAGHWRAEPAAPGLRVLLSWPLG